MNYHIRRSKVADMTTMLLLEGFKPPYLRFCETDFYRLGMVNTVATFERHVIGTMSYHRKANAIILKNLIVHPDHRRHGVATLLLNSALHHFRTSARTRIAVFLPERCVSMQLFMKHMGFQCISHSAICPSTNEQIYEFEIRKSREAPVPKFS